MASTSSLHNICNIRRPLSACRPRVGNPNCVCCKAPTLIKMWLSLIRVKCSIYYLDIRQILFGTCGFLFFYLQCCVVLPTTVFLVSKYCNFFLSTPLCSLTLPTRSTGQTLKRQTENLHVDYYVTKDFKSEYKGSALQQVEKNVEDDYVANVRNNCWKERQTSKC